MMFVEVKFVIVREKTAVLSSQEAMLLNGICVRVSTGHAGGKTTR